MGEWGLGITGVGLGHIVIDAKYGACLPALLGKGLTKEQWPLPAFLSGLKLPPKLSLWCWTIQFSSSLYVSLLPQGWSSEEVNQSKSEHGPFRRTLSPSASVPSGFYSQNLQGLLFLALEPRAGQPGVGLGPLAPQG